MTIQKKYQDISDDVAIKIQSNSSSKKIPRNTRNLLKAIQETAREQTEGDGEIEIKQKSIAERKIVEIKEDKMLKKEHKSISQSTFLKGIKLNS